MDLGHPKYLNGALLIIVKSLKSLDITKKSSAILDVVWIPTNMKFHLFDIEKLFDFKILLYYCCR